MTDYYESIRKMLPKLTKLIQELEPAWDAARYRRLLENCSVFDVVRAEDTDERANAALQDQARGKGVADEA